MTKNILKIFFILFFIFLFEKKVLAEDARIRQFPLSPKEGDEVKLTLESDKYDLSKAKVVWTVDGVERDNGEGRRTFNLLVTADKPVQIVVATIQQEGFYDSQTQIVVELSSDFILYEGADSYTPPFYKGRALPAKEGRVRVAQFSFKDGEINNFKTGTNANYTWKINGEEKSDLSGKNKILNIINSRVVDKNLNLEILRIDDTGTKQGTANISLQTPEVVLKKTNEKKLVSNVLRDTEIGKSLIVQVFPYFYSVDNKESNILKYTWKINDQETTPSKPWSVLFTGKERDSVKINLDLYHNQKLTQENSKGFTFRVE